MRFLVDFNIVEQHIVEFDVTNQNLRVEFDSVQTVSTPVEIEAYSGPYNVTPKTEPQTLKTADKRMTDDVSIKAIPYYEMDNQKGTTVFIGREV